MKLSAADLLSLTVLTALSVLTLALWRTVPGHPGQLLVTFATLGAFILVVSALDRPGLAWLHAFSPMIVLPVVFNSLEPLIEALSPTRWDATFAAIDSRYFPGVAAAWFGAFGRPAWLTDIIYVAYVSYYVLPVAVAVGIYLLRRREAFEEQVFVTLAAFYVSYLGYFLFPTLGPRVPLELEAAVLGGGVTSQVLRAFLDVAERTRIDAFPSGHTDVSLVTLILGWRYLPRWRPVLVPWVAAIVFATVYLHVHYVVDVVAGAAIAVLTIPAAAWPLHRLSQPPSVREWLSQVFEHLR